MEKAKNPDLKEIKAPFREISYIQNFHCIYCRNKKHKGVCK